MIVNLVKHLGMNRRLIWTLGLVTLLSSCLSLDKNGENNPSSLMSIKPSTSTPDLVLGVWEARNQISAQTYDVWRLKIEEGQIQFAVECIEDGLKTRTGGLVKTKFLAEEGRSRFDFAETMDFRVRKSEKETARNNEELNLCGSFVTMNSSAYAYVNRYRLELRPLLSDLEFEKISDLEADDKDRR